MDGVFELNLVKKRENLYFIYRIVMYLRQKQNTYHFICHDVLCYKQFLAIVTLHYFNQLSNIVIRSMGWIYLNRGYFIFQ